MTMWCHLTFLSLFLLLETLKNGYSHSITDCLLMYHVVPFVTHKTTSCFLYYALSLIVVIGAVFIVVNIQKVKDSLYIADELKLLGMVGVMIVAFYVTIAVVFDHTDPWRSMALYAALTVFTALETYISTKWVIDQFHKRRRKREESQSDAAVTLTELLKSKEGFEAFAAHLVHEYVV